MKLISTVTHGRGEDPPSKSKNPKGVLKKSQKPKQLPPSKSKNPKGVLKKSQKPKQKPKQPPPSKSKNPKGAHGEPHSPNEVLPSDPKGPQDHGQDQITVSKPHNPSGSPKPS